MEPKTHSVMQGPRVYEGDFLALFVGGRRDRKKGRKKERMNKQNGRELERDIDGRKEGRKVDLGGRDRQTERRGPMMRERRVREMD